jgi:PPOX class probable F420-dependent enzyme
MATTIDDPKVRTLLTERHHAVITTRGDDGSMHSAVVWVDVRDGQVAVNSAVGRTWPTNLERDPQVTVLVMNEANPYEYVEIRGTASGTTEGADDHIDRLAKKYLDADSYPFRQEGEQRITYRVTPTLVRYQKQ